MDGEVAQLAALVISANHRLAHPGDPMRWFPTQRAFARCGSIGFEAATKRRVGKPVLVPVAETPPAWLDRAAEIPAPRPPRWTALAPDDRRTLSEATEPARAALAALP